MASQPPAKARSVTHVSGTICHLCLEPLSGAEVTLYKADDLTGPGSGPWDGLAADDAIIFGAPTYMGSASAVFKQFQDASSKP